jgi:ABC-type glutathione transport system ATPase component
VELIESVEFVEFTGFVEFVESIAFIEFVEFVELLEYSSLVRREPIRRETKKASSKNVFGPRQGFASSNPQTLVTLAVQALCISKGSDALVLQSLNFTETVTCRSLESGIELVKLRPSHRECSSPKDVGFSVREGEHSGIMGRNRSRKSTSSEMPARVTYADRRSRLSEGEAASFAGVGGAGVPAEEYGLQRFRGTLWSPQ